MDSKEPPKGHDAPGSEPGSIKQREIDRRRDELLAGARGGGSPKVLQGTQLAGIGLQFVISVLICLYIGMWADKKFGTSPWLLLLGMLTGAGIGFYAMVQAMISENKRNAGEDKKQ
jgi:F0F1-type ATP synthase assembly protein I